MNRPNLQDGHVDEVPFGPVPAYLRYFITRLHPHRQETVADVVDDFPVLFDAVFRPFPVVLRSKNIIFGLKRGFVVGQQIKQAGYFHNILWFNEGVNQNNSAMIVKKLNILV